MSAISPKLMKYGIGISIVALGGCIWMEKQIQKTYRDQDYYQNSVVLLQKYEPAGEILGRPILSGKLNLGNENEVQIQPLSAKVTIPLKGSKQDGMLHVVASRLAESDKWNIDQLDLELKSSKQRWMFYDRNRIKDNE